MLSLRPYQIRAEDALRQNLRDGVRVQVASAPTGSGKTVLATSIMQKAVAKGSRSLFIVDRITLVNQTSEMFRKYGIEHGVIQGSNSFHTESPVLVCSAQTLERRESWPHFDLAVVDECHTGRANILEYIQNSSKPFIGLTATPFADWMGQVYERVVSVATTYQLMDEGFLVPLKVYAGTEIDMSGAKTVAGEWTDGDADERGRAIIGDIVSEWVGKCAKEYGEVRKTIVFTPTVDYGRQLAEQFQMAGYDFRLVSYLDKYESDRNQNIRDFREGRCLGLISCEALAKGFDVPDVDVLIDARPLRKSLSAHIQKLGRVMRASPGKQFGLVLDHTGNYTGFYKRMDAFFREGVTELTSKSFKDEPREVKEKEKRQMECRECGYVMSPKDGRSCPSCGWERPSSLMVEHVKGELKEVVTPSYKLNPVQTWYELCALAYRRKVNGRSPHFQVAALVEAKKWASVQYKNIFGGWPPRDWDYDHQRVLPTMELERTVQNHIIRWAKRNAKRRA